MGNSGQRRHKRYEVQDVHGSLLFRTQVHVRNLSVSGLALETPERLQLGRTYAIRLAGNDDAVDVSGTKVDHILAKGNDPVTFPVTVKGTLSSPDYSYAEVPEHFAKVAMENMTGAAKGRAKQEVMKRVTEQAPAPAKKLMEGLGKRLFH